MALNVNNVILAGNLTRDPEIKTTASGMVIANLSVAVNTRFSKDKEEVYFANCTAFAKTAEFCARMPKGHPVYIEARLKDGSYEKDGAKVYRTDIIVNKIQSCAPLPGGSYDNKGSVGIGDISISDEDMPF